MVRRDDQDGSLGVLVAAVRVLLVAAGVAATLPVVASLALRQVTTTSPRVVAYVAGTPLVIAAGVGATTLFLLGRSRAGTAVAGVLTSVLALTQVPLYLGTGAPAAGSSTLTVMTLNMLRSNADPAGIVAAVREGDVDVLAVQELDDAGVAALQRAGVGDLLPYDVLRPASGVHGTGLWSATPFTELTPPEGFRNPPTTARLDRDGRPLVVASVHPVSPYPNDTPQWSLELDLLEDWLAALDGPAVVAGDFNATTDHRQFRDLLATGFADAATQAGSGWLPTFPANRRRVPLLITIDHVLASDGIVATDVDRVVVEDTDHAALVARLAVPPEP